MSLFAVLARILRMLLGTSRMFLTLCVIALAVMFRRGAMGFGSIFVMLGCFFVFFVSHLIFSRLALLFIARISKPQAL
jgi:hypothetical protein